MSRRTEASESKGDCRRCLDAQELHEHQKYPTLAEGYCIRERSGWHNLDEDCADTRARKTVYVNTRRRRFLFCDIAARTHTHTPIHVYTHTCTHTGRAASLTDGVSILESSAAGRLPLSLATGVPRFRPAGASLRLMTAAFAAPPSDPRLFCAAVICVNAPIYLSASLAPSEERTRDWNRSETCASAIPHMLVASRNEHTISGRLLLLAPF